MIIQIQRPDKAIDINKEFAYYKYAIPECEPIKLSNGNYLHVYKVTKYSRDSYIYGDIDEEMDTINGM